MGFGDVVGPGIAGTVELEALGVGRALHEQIAVEAVCIAVAVDDVQLDLRVLDMDRSRPCPNLVVMIACLS